MPYVPWVWVNCIDYLCGHARAVPLTPWAIRWGVNDPSNLIRRRFFCSMCGKRGAIFTVPGIQHATGMFGPYPVEHFIKIGGRRQEGESCNAQEIRCRAHYLARYPSGDALGEFSGPYMCNLYSVTTNKEAIRELARAIGEWTDHTGNLQPLPSVFPDQLAPVVRATPDGGRELIRMRWGFPPPPKLGNRPVTNVRNTKSNWWRAWLEKPEYRCLVPVTSFCEPDHRSGKNVWTWYAINKNRPVFFFAGIWRPWTGTRGTKAEPVTGEHLLFSFLTTEPNAEVAPVHEKAMPVLLLSKNERETWMTAPTAEALELQRPAPDGTLKVVATGSTKDAA